MRKEGRLAAGFRFQTLFEDERAQATVEYIFLMAIIMGFVLLLFRTVLKPGFKKLSEAASKRFDSFFGNFHYFPIGRR